MKKTTISIKISWMFSLLIFFSVLIFSIISISFVNNLLMQQKKEDLYINYTNIASQSKKIFELIHKNPNIRFPSDLGVRLAVDSRVPYYLSFSLYVVNNDEPNIFKPLISNDPFLPLLSITATLENQKKTAIFFEEDYFLDGNLDLLYYCNEVYKTDSITIYLQTAINLDRDASAEILRKFLLIIALISIPLLLFSFCCSMFFTARLLKPVSKITQTAKKISGTSLDQRIFSSNNGDELSELANTFNNLFERLEQDFNRERQFTSDVSHELKTPLAVILGHARLLNRWGKNDEAVLKDSLETIQSEAESMNEMIQNLLLLSRTESKINTNIDLHLEAINFDMFFNKLKEDVKILSENAKVEIFIKENSSFEADYNILLQVARIIISNSIKYSKEEPHLIFEAQENKLIFQDFGQGIEEEDLPKIFDRFYRADESRNKKTGGTGLGLAIAKNLLSLMNISIEVESTFGKGTKMILQMNDQLQT